MIIYQYWFISYDKWNILLGDVNNRGNWVGGIWELSEQQLQPFCKAKTVKIKSFFKIVNKNGYVARAVTGHRQEKATPC